MSWSLGAVREGEDKFLWNGVKCCGLVHSSHSSCPGGAKRRPGHPGPTVESVSGLPSGAGRDLQSRPHCSCLAGNSL